MKFDHKKIKKMKKIITILFGILLLYSCSTSTDPKGNSVTTVIPLSPTNLLGTVASTSQINLSWTDNSTNETGFKIERKTSTGTYVLVGTTLTDISNFSDTGLSPNTTYTYRIYSYNSVGNSLTYSNELTLTTNTLIVLPTVTTTVATLTIGGNATSGGNITDSGNGVITARGVVWGTSSSPTISLSTKTSDGTGNGVFVSAINGLVSGTTYFARAYATNSAGTSYGNEITFTETAVPSNGLVGYWPFNGNANDVSGNNLNGTVNGPILSSDRFGALNSSYEFNMNYIKVDYSLLLNISNNLSVNLWYKISDLMGTINLNPVFVSRHISASTNSSFVLYNVNSCGPTVYQTDIDNRVNYIRDTTFCDVASWHMLTLTFNKPNMIMYLDGNYYSTIVSNDIKQTLLPLIFGGTNNSSNVNDIIGRMKGKLDDIGIWNRALTQAEITALYNSTGK